MNSREIKQREKILKGAQEMFMAQGFTNISTAQIAKYIRVSKTTLYKHFPTKDALLEETVVYILNNIENQLIEVLQNDKLSIVQKIEDFLLVVVSHLSDLKIDVISDVKLKNPNIYSLVMDRQSQIINKYVMVLFQDAVEEGIFRPDIDQQIAIDVLIHSVKVLGSPEYLRHSPHTFESMFQQIFKLVMEGYLIRDSFVRA